jgi:hypothetical protein
MFKKFLLLTVIFCAVGLAGAATETSAQTKSRVRFARGTTAATVKGRIAGYQYVDYIVGVRAGQTLSFRLNTTGPAEVVLFTPSDDNVDGALGVEDYSGTVEYTGDYKVRVLMPRAFARRKSSSNYTLRISVQ